MPSQIRNFIIIALLALPLLANAQEQEQTTFEVNKFFTDGNPSEVEVTLNCFTGIPLVQSQMISESQNVVFIVESFADGELDCNVTEEEVFGYTADYNDGLLGSPDACVYEDVGIGDSNVCDITNTPDPVEIVIEKDWIIEGPGGDSVDQNFYVTMLCNAEIIGGVQLGVGDGFGGACLLGPAKEGAIGGDAPPGELWCLTMHGYGDEIFTPEVIPNYPSSICQAGETVYDSAVESDNGCAPPIQGGTGRTLVVSAGVGDSCTITNTVFFEGIPTLSQYGMAILALLMLGVGFVGFRRFV